MLTLLEPPSPSSSDHSWDDKIPPVGSSRVIPQSSDPPQVISTPEARPQENVDAVESLQGRSIFKKWLQRKSDDDSTSHKPNQPFRKSHQPNERQSPSELPVRVDATYEGPSRMAVSALPPNMVCLTYFSLRVQKSSNGDGFVVPHICIQGLTTRYSVKRLQRLLKIREKTLLAADKLLRIQTKLTMCVLLW